MWTGGCLEGYHLVQGSTVRSALLFGPSSQPASLPTHALGTATYLFTQPEASELASSAFRGSSVLESPWSALSTS